MSKTGHVFKSQCVHCSALDTSHVLWAYTFLFQLDISKVEFCLHLDFTKVKFYVNGANMVVADVTLFNPSGT